MKNLIKRTSVLLALLLLWGGLIAPSSQALNVYTTKASFCTTNTGWYNLWRVYDYNAWEESWLGGSHRDYRVLLGTYRDYGLDAFCRSWW